MSYAQAAGRKEDSNVKGARKLNTPGQFESVHLTFNVDNKIVEYYNNTYVGVVAKSGATYATKAEFVRRGILEVKVTPMGTNLVLLEELEEGALTKLLAEIWIGFLSGLQKLEVGALGKLIVKGLFG